MADESEEMGDVVSPDVEVIGLEKIAHFKLLSSLFVAGKAWILSLWKDRTDQIKSMTVLDKFIGKNDGFVIKVCSSDPDADTLFFAKVQRASMDTVLVHHLLKNMKCGPERFHIVLLDGWQKQVHGVITEEVKEWCMAEDLTSNQTTSLLTEKKRLTTTAFILVILIQLGRFGFIPSNRENWGFVEGACAAVPYPHMAVIDFSRGENAKHIFDSRVCFERNWQGQLQFLFNKWQPRCGPIEDLQLFRDRMEDLRKSLMHGTCIEDEIQHFPFLQSREALMEVLQSACDETAVWLHEAISAAQVCSEDRSIDSDSSDLATLKIFRHIPPPNVANMTGLYKGLVVEYMQLVTEWNKSVANLIRWFPFPGREQN